MIDVKKIRSLFPIYKDKPNISYLDSAASSLKLKSVIKSLSDYYLKNGSNVHRGVYKLAAEATEGYEKTREVVADFLNAEVEEIIFTKGTSHGLNMLVNSLKKNLKPGDEVISSQLEHHSSVLPWLVACKETGAMLKFIPLNEENKITVKNFSKVLTNQTRVVALTHSANTMGYLTPIKEITKLAHKKGALVILDAAQSASHIKLDVQALDVDYLAFSAHKMYGPNGVGVLYGKKTLLEDLEPSEFGGEMVHQVFPTYATWKDSPYKFETGTPAIAEVIAFKRAIEFIRKVGFKKIREHEHLLHQYTLNKLKDIDGITIYNKEAETPIILLNIDGVHPHDVASMLDSHDVCVRAGHHCAQYVMQFLDTIATIRISFAIYNSIEDCDKVIDALIETRDFFNGF